MMNIVGLHHCTNQELQFFSILTPVTYSECNLGKDPIINRIMVDGKVIDMEVEEKKDKYDLVHLNQKTYVHFSICMTYKVFYTNKESAYIKVEEESFIHRGCIQLPCHLEGTFAHKLINQKKAQLELMIQDVEFKLIGERQMMIAPYIIVNFNYRKQYTLAYNITYNEQENNIFLAHTDGKKIIQKTFTYKIVHHQMIFGIGMWTLAYLKSDRPQSVFVFDMTLNKCTEIAIAVDAEQVEAICAIGMNKYAVLIRISGQLKIYELDAETQQIHLLVTSKKEENCYAPQYCSQSHSLFYIKQSGERQHLYQMDLATFEIQHIYDLDKSLTYESSYDGTYIGMIEEQESLQQMVLLNTRTKQTSSLSQVTNKYRIKSVKFAPRALAMVMLLEIEGQAVMGLYDLVKRKFLEVTRLREEVSVSDYCISGLGDCIYMACNEREYYDLYKIDLRSLEKTLITNCHADDIQIAQKVL